MTKSKFKRYELFKTRKEYIFTYDFREFKDILIRYTEDQNSYEYYSFLDEVHNIEFKDIILN